MKKAAVFMLFPVLMLWGRHLSAGNAPEANRIIKKNARSGVTINIPDENTFSPEARKLEKQGIRLLWTKGRSGKGARMLEQAISKEARLVIAPSHLALYYQRGLHNNRKAVAVLEKAIKYHPKSPWLFFSLANVYAYEKDHRKAILYYLKAMELGYSGQASLQYNLANSYLHSGNGIKAIQSYEKALAIDPRHDGARKNLIYACMRTNNITKALAYAGDSAELTKRLAVSLGRTGHYKEALRVYNRAVELLPDDFETNFNRALTLDRLNRSGDALTAYEKASELRPHDPDPLFNAALLLKRLKHNDLSLTYIDRAIALAPRRAEFHFARGIILSELNRHDEALEAYEQTLKLDPGHKNAAMARKTLLMKMGRHSE